MTENAVDVLDILELKSRMILREDINLDDRIVHIRGAITSKNADKFMKALSFLENVNDDPITIVINTPGGDVYTSFAIIDRIQNSPCHITTIATGLVASAGIPILCSGNVRKATRLTTLMYHEPSFNLPFDRLTSAELETKHVKQLGQRLNKFMAQHTTQSYAYWTKVGKHLDFYFDVEKALDLGVIDSIEGASK